MKGLSAMERLLLPLVRRFVGLWVRPSVLPDDVAARLGSGRTVVYALEKRSIIDFAVLEYVCRERSLPAPSTPVGAGAQRLRQPPLDAKSEQARAALEEQRGAKPLRTLSGLAATDPAFDADVVPVSFFWGRAPDRERSWANLWIAEDWDIGGRLRKLVSLVVNGRNLLVLFGETLPLAETLGETRGMPLAPRRMWRQLRTQFRNQRTATIGPDLSHRRTVVAQVLSTQMVRDAAREETRTRSRPTIRIRSCCSCRACSAGFGTGSTTASSSRTSRASSRWTTARRSCSCRATAATWTTCCCPTWSTTRVSPSRTSPPASTSTCR
jgi:glycerol-3-phosphate O-acyltransferase